VREMQTQLVLGVDQLGVGLTIDGSLLGEKRMKEKVQESSWKFSTSLEHEKEKENQ
jgi:hypothetical protein